MHANDSREGRALDTLAIRQVAHRHTEDTGWPSVARTQTFNMLFRPGLIGLSSRISSPSPMTCPLISVLPLTGTSFLSSQIPCSSKPGIFTPLPPPLVNSYSYDRTQSSITSSRESHLIFHFKPHRIQLFFSTLPLVFNSYPSV